jgi:hypothetical protein
MAVVLVIACPSASAAVYKCTDANGKLAFQQQPCPQEAQGERLNVGADWRLLDETDSGQYGSSRTYFDPEHIATIDGLRRVTFKRNYTPGSSGRIYPNQEYYHFFECATGRMSLVVAKGAPAPSPADRGWSNWQERHGPYPNIRQVFDAACPAGPPSP